MTTRKPIAALAIAGASLASLGLFSANALTTQFFGEDINHNGSVPPATYPNALAAQTSFLSYLTGVGTEDFEGIPEGTFAPSIVFPGAGTASLSEGTVISVPHGTANGVGRWATSGDHLLEANADALTITFDNPGGVAAFGFYGTDIGDFGGSLTLDFISGASLTIPVGNTVGSGASTDGSVLYFGYINTDDPFTSVVFHNSSGGADFFGFDDMTIGSIEQVSPPTVPEASTSLAGLSLALIIGSRMYARRRQA